MDSKTYELITRICTKHLIKKYHDRHLKDCIQDCAMMYFEGRTNIVWNVIEYCRKNGLSNRSKLGAKTLESSLSIDAPSKNEESENSNYLLDQESISRSEHEAQSVNQDDTLKGYIEEFLFPIGLKSEVMRWVTENYKIEVS